MSNRIAITTTTPMQPRRSRARRTSSPSARGHAAALAQIAHSETWESQPDRTFGVARAIYRMLPDDARLWRAGQDFEVIERARIVGALAA